MRSVYVEALSGQPRARPTSSCRRRSPRRSPQAAEGRGLVGVRLRLAAVESAVSVRRVAAARACAACIAASACGRWRRAARPDAPGLVLGLDRGGSCPGVAYRLPAPLAIDELHLLWRREMVTGAYEPRWVKLDADGKPLIALTFMVRRDHPQYAGRLARRRAGARDRQRLRRVRLVGRLPRAHARRARHARRGRSVSRDARARRSRSAVQAPRHAGDVASRRASRRVDAARPRCAGRRPRAASRR